MSYFNLYESKPCEKFELLKNLIDNETIESIMLCYNDGYFDRYVRVDKFRVIIDGQTSRTYDYGTIELDNQYNICFDLSIGEFASMTLKIDLNCITQYWV